ncbi:MAG: hypothetical protein EZS28_004179 [Streblomastix strix]|uniref:Uncharacterized protein n=1 Tax=Streblomastix strix TaxID=222440 RepID=A0A5J4X0G6_9EUKA|nr:MAG: hypothetical protein EZS28_004179 [Streblomastix strix]
MEQDDDDNHHHHHHNREHDHDYDRNHRHERDREDRNNQLDLGSGRKRRRVSSNEGAGNAQNNDDWAEGLHREVNRQQLRVLRIQFSRQEQTRGPVQDPVYRAVTRTAQEEAFRRINNISPNLDEKSSVS